jgi:hypothetical protein
VNAGEEDHQGVWTPNTCEQDVRTGVQSEEKSPLGCVHEGRENARGSTVAAKDVRGIQDVPDDLVHAPIHHDDQEEYGDPKAYHALVVVPRGGKSAVNAVSGWPVQVPRVACLQ